MLPFGQEIYIGFSSVVLWCLLGSVTHLWSVVCRLNDSASEDYCQFGGVVVLGITWPYVSYHPRSNPASFTWWLPEPPVGGPTCKSPLQACTGAAGSCPSHSVGQTKSRGQRDRGEETWSCFYKLSNRKARASGAERLYLELEWGGGELSATCTVDPALRLSCFDFFFIFLFCCCCFFLHLCISCSFTSGVVLTFSLLRPSFFASLCIDAKCVCPSLGILSSYRASWGIRENEPLLTQTHLATEARGGLQGRSLHRVRPASSFSGALVPAWFQLLMCLLIFDYQVRLTPERV